MISRRVFLKKTICASSLINFSNVIAAQKSGAVGSDTRVISTKGDLASGKTLIDRNFGVRGDGTSNDTESLQRAIDGSVGQTLLITGNCRIDSNGLDLRSGSRLVFAQGASLKLLPHSTNSYQMLRIWQVRDVFVKDARLDGSKELSSADKDPVKNGYGMGISIAGSENINLISPSTINCWGDGIYIANGYRDVNAISKNVNVDRHYASGCRRQGVSIISGDGILFTSPVWENIGGTAPGAGLDIEPDRNTDVLRHIRIVDPKTTNCKAGVLIALSHLVGERQKEVDITIVRHRDEGSGVGFSVPGFDLDGHIVKGRITSESPIWRRSARAPFMNKNYDARGPELIISTPSTM